MSTRRQSQGVRTLGVDVAVFAQQDAHSADDTASWAPIVPTFVTGGIAVPLRMRHQLAGFNPDILHLHGIWSQMSLSTRLWTATHLTPSIISPRGMLDPWALRNSRLKKVVAGFLYERRGIRKASVMHALCASERNSIRKFGYDGPICTIPNGVDIDDAAYADVELPAAFGDPRRKLLFLGRMHPKKGVVELVRAWQKAAAASPSAAREWMLIVAGWDEAGYTDVVREAVQSAGLADRVQIVGPLFAGHKVRAIRACEAFVLPSFSEGLPIAVLEAWAQGRPSLITDECNLPEGAEHECAFQVAPTIDAIAEGLSELFSSSQAELVEMGSRARELASARFSWDLVAKSTRDAYEWMLGGGPAPPTFDLGPATQRRSAAGAGARTERCAT